MSNKRDISWHESCLRNQEATIKQESDRIDNILSHLNEARKRLFVYRYQISEAKRMGKDGFDSERFLKPRKPSTEKSA